MPGKAAKVVITDRQDKILRAIVASRTSPVRLIERAKIILLAFEKKLNQEISHIVPLNPQQIGLWRKVLAQSEAGGPGSVRPSGAMRL